MPVLVYRHIVTDSCDYDPLCAANVVAFTREGLLYVTDPDENPEPPRMEKHTFIDMVAGSVVDEMHQQASYTGNSTAPETLGCIYFSVALLVGRPLGQASDQLDIRADS